MNQQDNIQIKLLKNVKPGSEVNISVLKDEILMDNTLLLRNQVIFLEDSRQKMQKILNHIRVVKQYCNQKMTKFQLEVNELSKHIHQHQTNLLQNQNDKAIQVSKLKTVQQQFVNLCQQRVTLANSLRVSKLKKININNRTSLANEIFKWIIVTIYNEPQSKYYWPNFKEQVFQKDDGKDFIQRMGKVNALQAKLEHKVKTEQFLSMSFDIIQTNELKPYKDQIIKIRDIAQYFSRGYKLADGMKADQTNIEKKVQQRQETNQEYKKWNARLKAHKDRYSTCKKYLDLINSLEEKLKSKTVLFKENSQKGKKVIADFSSSLQSTHSYKKNLNEGNLPPGTCQIF